MEHHGDTGTEPPIKIRVKTDIELRATELPYALNFRGIKKRKEVEITFINLKNEFTVVFHLTDAQWGQIISIVDEGG